MVSVIVQNFLMIFCSHFSTAGGKNTAFSFVTIHYTCILEIGNNNSPTGKLFVNSDVILISFFNVRTTFVFKVKCFTVCYYQDITNVQTFFKK